MRSPFFRSSFWVMSGVLSCLLSSGCGIVQKERWFAPTPIGEVAVRQMPAAAAIEAERKGLIDRDWTAGYRQDARYLASISSPLRYPVTLVVPQWQEQAPSQNVTFYVQLILAENAQYRAPGETGLSQVDLPGMNVACYAWEGGYTYEKFVKAHNKVVGYLRARGIPIIGSPRILLYHNPDWMPATWCVAELQIPIPDKITPE